MKKSLVLSCVVLFAAMALGVCGAAEPKVIAPESFTVEVRGSWKDFTLKPEVKDTPNGRAVCFEMPYMKGQGVWVVIDLGGADMLDELPTIDFSVEQTQKGRANGTYVSAVGGMAEKRIGVSTNISSAVVSKIHYEPGHQPHWASWTDPREMKRLEVFFPADSWDDTKAVQKIAFSSVSLLPDNSWKGTDRDADFHAWLKFCESYEPDFSDSSKFLEPPAEGRLDKPLKLVVEDLDESAANCEIVVYPDTYKSVEIAAQELQYWIREITGAEVPIVKRATKGKTMPRIHLNSPFAAKKWADDVAWLKKGADVDGYFVHTVGNNVYIGCAVPSDTTYENAESRGLPRDASAVGVFRGVVAFLENNVPIIFACEDAKLGTVYDKSSEFVVRWGDGRDRPATCGRGWLSGTDFSNVHPIGTQGNEIWRARNKTNVRMAHRLSGHGAQSGEFIEFFPDTDAYRVFDGKARIPFGYYDGQVCLGAPDALEQAVKHAVQKVETARKHNYPITSLGFWNEDNWRVCVCDKCTEPITLPDGRVLTSNRQTSKEGMSDPEQCYRSTQYMLFSNRLADALAEKYPGMKLELLAYFFQYRAPKCKVSPNVAWISAPYHNRCSYYVPMYHPLVHWPYRNMKEFQAAGGEMRLYEYHAFAGDINSSRWTSCIEAAAEDFRWLTAQGAKLLGSEQAYVNDPKKPFAAMHGWLFSQVGWHADLKEVSDLRKYYIRRVFREGAPIVEKYVLERVRAQLRPYRAGETVPDILRGGQKVHDMFAPYLKLIKNETARFHFQGVMGLAEKGQ